MSMVKMAGKYNRPFSTSTEVTTTPGLMQVDGTVIASSAYTYSQKISVSAGDVITFEDGNGDVHLWRVVTAFLDNTPIADAGYYPAAADRNPYTVPEGVNYIVITGSSNETVPLYAVRTGFQGIAKGIAADEKGNLIINRAWDGQSSLITTTEIRDTDGHYAPVAPFQVDNYALNSLRITNGLDQDVTIIFCDDLTGNQWLSDASGGVISITIPHDNLLHIVSADDIPAINYLKSIRLRLSCAIAPTSGNVKVWVVSRR